MNEPSPAPMRAETGSIATRRTDASRTAADTPAAPPVIATLPGGLSSDGLEILVRHQTWGVEVDVRPAGTRQTWTPIAMVGGSFEVRPS